MTEIKYTTLRHILLLDQELLFNLPIKNKIHVKKFNGVEYAYINKKIKGTRNTKTYLLHRLLMETFIGRKLNKFEKVDHINGNSLDNRIKNLRVCSAKENSRNRKGNDKGVRRTSSGKFSARITVDRKEIYLGSFSLKKEALQAYNTAATKYFGQFAKLNEE